MQNDVPANDATAEGLTASREGATTNSELDEGSCARSGRAGMERRCADQDKTGLWAQSVMP
eukprot:1138961-Pelagomonas_calceolata.AAC.5